MNRVVLECVNGHLHEFDSSGVDNGLVGAILRCPSPGALGSDPCGELLCWSRGAGERQTVVLLLRRARRRHYALRKVSTVVNSQ